MNKRTRKLTLGIGIVLLIGISSPWGKSLIAMLLIYLIYKKE